MKGLIDTLFNKHKLVRRTGMMLCFISTVVILVVAVLATVHNYPLSDPISKVFIAIVGLNTVYVCLYQWGRTHDAGLD